MNALRGELARATILRDHKPDGPAEVLFPGRAMISGGGR